MVGHFEMKNKYKDLTLNTLIFTISSFVSKFISFFLVPLYTAVLTTSEYGSVDLMTTTAQLLIPVLTLNVQDAVLRFTLDDNYNKEDIIKVSSRTIMISSLLTIVILSLTKSFGIIDLDNNYLFFLFFSYLMGTINNSLNMYLRSTNKMKIIGICGVINTFIACVANIFLLLVAKLGVNGYMIANILGICIANIGMFLFGNVWKDLKRGKWNKTVAKAMFAYGIPLVANSIAWWINNASDRYILTFFCGTALNGVYSVAYKIPSILSMLQNTFYNAWSVSAITEYDKEDSDGFIGNVFMLYTVASIILCSGIMLFNMFIAKIAYSNDFFVAWKYVPLLLVGTLFNGLGLFIGCMFTAVKRTKDISSTTILGAIANTVLNFMLIPIIGAFGAAFATLVGYFVVFLIRLIRLRYIVKMKVKWTTIIFSLIFLGIQCSVATISNNSFLQIPLVICIIVMNKSIFIKIVETFIKKTAK